MPKLHSFFSKTYAVFTNKKLVTIIIMGAAILLISGFPAYISTLIHEGNVEVAVPNSLNRCDALKHIAFSPVAAFFYAISFIGILGIRQIKNPKYTNFAPLCYIFICIGYGLIILLFKFTLT